MPGLVAAEAGIDTPKMLGLATADQPQEKRLGAGAILHDIFYDATLDREKFRVIGIVARRDRARAGEAALVRGVLRLKRMGV